jgi:hypothetical protein
MRLYPSLPRRRRATLLGDAVVVVLVVLFAVLGRLVHDSVAELASLGRAVGEAGTTIQDSTAQTAGAVRDGLGTAADAVDGVPIVGGEVAGGLRAGAERATGALAREGAQAGGEIVDAGREGEDRANGAARVLGWSTFLVPVVLLLTRWGPRRLEQARTLTAAERVLRADARAAPERVRVLAERAAYGLPYGTLVRHSRDPMGDLLAGNHAPLVAALGEDAGLDLHDDALTRGAGDRVR